MDEETDSIYCTKMDDSNMIIWDDILEQHNIRIKGAAKAQLNKYLGDTKLPNKNVMAAQAETVVMNFINNALSGTNMHFYIHIFSFPKKTEETNPFNYLAWLGPIGIEPTVFPGDTYWWELQGS